MRNQEQLSERNKLLQAMVYPAIGVLLLWLVKLFEVVFDFSLSRYGLIPRDVHSLPAIFTMPFLHGDWKHLMSNTGPFFILGSFIFYFYREIAWKVIGWIYLLSGLWLWIGGREAVHIGASALVYGFAAFLFFSGIFKRNTSLMVVTLIITFLYGSMVWGFFPEFFPNENISWEGHLFGFIAGLLMAVYYRKEGPQKIEHQWDEDEDGHDENPYWESDHPSDKSALDEHARPTHFHRR